MKQENYIKFFQALTAKEKQELADYCNVSLGHLRNVSYGLRRCSAELAVGIEEWSKGKINRYNLGVRNAERIWGAAKASA